MNSTKRIMIIDQPGSGKSTLARRLGEILNLPVFHMDQIHWQSGWIERPKYEKDKLCMEVHAKEQWIFEGGRSAERLQRADTLVWLDVSLHVRSWRVFLRTIKYYGKSRPDLPKGCPERFSWEFMKWIWNTRNSGQIEMKALFDSTPANKEKVRLTGSDDMKTYLAEVSNSHSP